MRSKSFIMLILALIIVGGVLMYATLVGWAPDKPETIILISMDTTRADHLSCYGYEHETTPNIDVLAKESLFFENAFSPVPMTLPSHSSMFTGLIPPTHGVHYNLEEALPESQLTLPEILQENGYSTYGIVSAEVLNNRFGIGQGFDVYDDVFDKDVTTSNIAERHGKETTEHALKWLSENADKKKFMFIHYFDPHDKYSPPPPYHIKFQHPYDGEIAFTDHCIGQIFDKLKSLGLYDDSLIIIVGDHGEMLGEHGESGHAYFIYQNVLHVPLMFKLPGGRSAKAISEACSIIDVTPTVLSLAGIHVPDAMQGVDLSQYSQKDFSSPERLIYSESMTPTMYNCNSLLGIISDQWHYIQTTRPELYDRIKDPGELENLIAKEPQRARIMQDQLKEILESSVRTDIDTSIELDEETVKKLESLGYVSGDVEADFSFDQSKDDPKDLLETHVDLARAQRLILLEQFDEAIELCNKTIKERPYISKSYRLLSTVYMKRESYDKVIDVMQKKRMLTPDDIDALKTLSNAYVLTEDYPKAIEVSNEFLELEPDNAEIHFILGNIYRHLKDVPKAMEKYHETVKLNPKHRRARIILAESYIMSGRPIEALAHYEQIVLLDDGYINGHNSIAWIKATHEDAKIYDPVSALSHAQKAAELSEYNDPEVLDTLGVAQSANGQFEAAIETASKAVNIYLEKGLPDSAGRIQKNLDLYKQHKTLRQ